MTNNKNLQDLVTALTDEELCQAVKESNAFDNQGDMSLDSALHRITEECFPNYSCDYLEIVSNNIYKEAANRFLRANTELTCFECKHSEYSYNQPSMGEGEPELEFYCNNPCVQLDYEDEITEEDLSMIAATCSFYEVS